MEGKGFSPGELLPLMREHISPGVLVVANEFSPYQKACTNHGRHDYLSRARYDTAKTAGSSGGVLESRKGVHSMG